MNEPPKSKRNRSDRTIRRNDGDRGHSHVDGNHNINGGTRPGDKSNRKNRKTQANNRSLDANASTKKPALWLQTLKILTGMLLMNLLTYFCFTVSYTVVGFVHEKKGQTSVTERQLLDGRLIASAYEGKPDSAELTKMLQALSKERHYTVTFATADSKSVIAPAGETKTVSKLTEEDKEQVLGGSEVKHVYRKYPFSEGTAVAGVPITVGGERHGIFLEEKAPSLYQGFWQQVMTVFFGFLLMFILMLLIGRPWRERGGVYVYISAIRRMSKGDFTVMIDKPERMHGHFGELATSINDMAMELNQMEQMRQAFISNVSHEIQSPLTSIRGFARALQQDGLEEQQRQHYAGIIESESVRLSKLSDNLMKLTTLEADQQSLHPKSYRLDHQLRSTILALEPIWTEKDILMDVHLEERVQLTGDEELLSQVWMNLIANSLKFTDVGGSVSVEVKRLPEGAVVVVSDNGIGIAEEDLPHIFERFFKADKSRSRRENGNGSGLGLSIVKVIVDMHGGQLTARSKLGAGTTITVTLPNLPAEQSGAEIVR